MRQKKAQLAKLLLGIVIFVLLLVLLVFILSRITPGWFNWIKFMPWSHEGNGTDNEPPPEFECPLIVARLHVTWGRDYFYMEGRPTALYLHRNKEIWLNPTGEWTHKQIGFINENGVVFIIGPFVDGKSQEFAEYSKRGLPRIELMRQLHESFRVRNFFCRSRDQLIEQEKCEENCSSLNGVCSLKPVKGKIIIGELDCDMQYCYANKTDEILENGNLRIKEFTGNKENLLEKEEWEIVFGMEGLQVFKYAIESSNEFCYVLRTNKEVIHRGSAKGTYNPERGSQTVWIPSAEDKIIELHAWEVNNPERKVVKRIYIGEMKLPDIKKDDYINVIPEKYEPGKPVEEDKIYGEVKQAKVGDVFYVTEIRFQWYKKGGKSGGTADYKIKKIDNDKVEISVYNLYPEQFKWHKLDCIWDFHVFGIGDQKYLEIEKLKQGLMNALTEYCYW